MVHIGGSVVHTGQLYFSDAVTDAVYRRSPLQYAAASHHPTRTASTATVEALHLKLVKKGSAWPGSITMGVQRLQVHRGALLHCPFTQTATRTAFV